MIEPFDPVLFSIASSILINVLTQIGKPFHKSPLQVFYFVAFFVCIAYGLLEYFVGHDAVVVVGMRVVQIVAASAGFWHIIMRPEGVVMQFIAKMKKSSK